MSEGQQEPYNDDQSLGDVQQSQLHRSSSTVSPDQPPMSPSHKRKRESIDEGEGREGSSGREGSTSARRTSFNQTSPNLTGSFMPVNTNPASTNPANQFPYQPLNMAQQQGATAINGQASSEAASAALAAAGAMSGLLPQMTVPQPTAMNFGEGNAKSGEQHVQMDGGFGTMSPQPAEGHTEGVGGAQHAPQQPTHHPAPAPNPKPQVGTEEWHRVRRDNHKEVERRRRETINEGINELAKIVPGCEKNKGSILQRAVQYIQQLKENEAQNIEKWTLEKLLTEQAIQELSQNNEKLQKECERAWREAETWKKSCLQAGVTREGGGQTGSS